MKSTFRTPVVDFTRGKTTSGGGVPFCCRQTRPDRAATPAPSATVGGETGPSSSPPQSTPCVSATWRSATRGGVAVAALPPCPGPMGVHCGGARRRRARMLLKALAGMSPPRAATCCAKAAHLAPQFTPPTQRALHCRQHHAQAPPSGPVHTQNMRCQQRRCDGPEVKHDKAVRAVAGVSHSGQGGNEQQPAQLQLLLVHHQRRHRSYLTAGKVNNNFTFKVPCLG